MPPRICTACDVPHITSDYYVKRGYVECAPHFEDRIRRETREKTTEPSFSLFGYTNSIVSPDRRVRYAGPGKAA
jgi:hypothetical protein